MSNDGGTEPAIAVYALTSAGAALGDRLAKALGGELHVPERLAGSCPGQGFASLPALVSGLFERRRGHVFIAAAGLVVRIVAPLLRGKDRDPAVVVLDQQGRYAISLLSGHLGGANALARQVAELTGGEAVITTATDTAGVPAIDLLALEAGLRVGSAGAIKHINARLLANEPVGLDDPEDWLGLADASASGASLFGPPRAGVPLVRVGCDRIDPANESGEPILHLHPRCLCAGIGFHRGATAQALTDFVLRTLAQQGLAAACLGCLATIELKRDDPGLIAAARTLGAELRFYPAEALRAVVVPHPSSRPAQHVGTPSVSEAAALLAAKTTTLLVEKIVCTDMTLALAKASRS